MDRPPRYRARLLLVHASTVIARVHRRHLETLGYEVACIGDPLEAVHAVLGNPPDILLVDHELPGMGGDGLCRLLRGHRQTSELGIVLFSREESPRARVEGLRLGADAVLGRQPLMEELDAVLQSLLRSRSRLHSTAVQLRQLSLVLDSLDSAVLVFDDRGRVRAANRRAFRLLCLDPDIIELRSVPEILHHIGVSDDLVTRVMAGGEPVRGELHLALDGESRDLLLRSTRIAADEASHALSVLVLVDLTDQREHERLKADFHSMIAHDLRNPISVIQGYVMLLRAERLGELSMAQMEFLDRIHLKVEDITRLLNDFLDLSKLDAGCIVLESGRFALRELLERSLDDLALLARDREMLLELSVEREVHELVLDGDAGRVGQVLQNLLTNAMKYSPDGSTIQVTARRERGSVIVEVSDEGPGIPPDKLEEIFERYVRVKEGSEAVAGIGLGLMIVRKIVQAHGGEVGVRSDGNQGSTFWFTLPIVSHVDSANARVEILPNA